MNEAEPTPHPSPDVTAVWDALSQRFALLDRKGTVRFANRAALRTRGADASGVVGRSLWETPLWPGDPSSAAKLREALTKADGQERRGTLAARDATWEWRLAPLDVPSGPALLFEWREAGEPERLRQRLARSEERYRAFVQHSGEGIYLFELSSPIDTSLPTDEQIRRLYRDGYIAECNERFAWMYGYDGIAAMLGERLGAIHGTEDNAQNLEFLREWVESGYRIMNAISEEVTKDGERVYLSNNCIGVVEEGRLMRVWGSQHDITDTRNADRERAQTEEMFRTLVEYAPEAIVLFDGEDGRFVAVNGNAETLFQLPRDELLQRTFEQMSAAPHGGGSAKGLIDAYVYRALHGESPVFEWSCAQPGGVGIPCEVRLVRLPTQDAPLIRGSITDISERRRKDETLRRHNARLESLREIGDAILSAASPYDIAFAALQRLGDLIPCRRASVTELDPDSRRFRVVAFVGEDIPSLAPGKWLPPDKFGGLMALQAGDVHEDEWELGGPGDTVHLYALNVPLISSGELVGTLNLAHVDARRLDAGELAIAREIAGPLAIAFRQARLWQRVREHADELERSVAQRTRELASAKEQAEAADRMKTAFLASMSHELRTPLNSIIGFTGLIHNEVVGPLNNEQKAQLGMVRKSSYHLLKLINDVLDVSRIEAGRMDLDVRPFRLDDALADVLGRLQPLAAEKRLEFHQEVDDDIDTVISDRRRVEQVLTNLVSNAVKFTERGRVTVRCSRDGGELVLAVRDTGIGIDESDQERIFEAFFQVDHGVARRHDGTGLGLSIASRLAQRLGGTLSVESALGRGSEFTFRLPDAIPGGSA